VCSDVVPLFPKPSINSTGEEMLGLDEDDIL
jgi:hypothetical protein